ncbi:hypothetical protein [Alicyclobacillus sendaiensis]|uniref:hypothetical protein n=1 Tax=Alicyclobacillus sendaiensis TaxID=192387 RepID=UPI000782CAA7
MPTKAPRAVWWYTWRSLRWWLVTTPFVLGRGLLSGFLFANAPHALRQELVRLAMGQEANVLDLGVLWSIGLGVVGLATRRVELMSVLAGPARRRDVYGAHAFLTGGTLVISQILCLVGLWALNARMGLPASQALVAHVMFKRLLVDLAAWSAGVAAAATIAHPVAAGISAIGVAGFPVYAGTFIEYVSSKWNGPHPSPLSNDIMHLSPLMLLDRTTGGALVAYGIWFVAWIALWLALGAALFERLPLEHLNEVFPFAVYQRLFALGIALLAGFLVTVWAAQAMGLGVGKAAAIEVVLIWMASCTILYALRSRRPFFRLRRWDS